MKEGQKEQRKQALTRSGSICPVCGGSINTEHRSMHIKWRRK